MVLIIWIAVFFLGEPLLVGAYALVVVRLFKKNSQTLHQVAVRTAWLCVPVAAIMLLYGFERELNSQREALVLTVVLFVAHVLLRPVIFNALFSLVTGRNLVLEQPRTTTVQPWIYPGSHPPPGWTDEA